MITLTQYIVLGLLCIPSIILLCRTYFVKERFFLVTIACLVVIGEVAGILVAYYAYNTMSIAADWKLLLETAKTNSDLLILQQRLVEYSTGVFFTSFNVAHWMFAMRYWGLSLRLQWFVYKKEF